jgi:RNA polymerase sigma-70 factor (ECF subfamily)
MELLRPDGPGPPHPDDAAIDGIAVQSALAALPRREREVLALRFAADLSVPQVAAVLGCPEGTVKTIARRGLERLREDPAIGALRPPAEPQEGLDVR